MSVGKRTMTKQQTLAAGTLAILAMSFLAGCGTPSTAPRSMEAIEAEMLEAERAYKIEDMLGIGETYGKKLRTVGVTNSDKLLDRAKTRSQRQKLAEEAGVPYKLLLQWAQKV